MNLLHLQYFYMVAKENGFTKASKVLRIQQPAISRMVKLLEEDLGLKLFERIGRNVQLTSEGAEVFEYCKKIFGSVEELKNSISQQGHELKGLLTMAASEPVASHFLPRIASTFQKKHPNVHPNIFSGPASLLFEKLKNGEIEFGLFFHIPELPDKLEIFEKLQIRYHLVIRKDLKKNRSTIESFIGSREIDDTFTRKFPTLERLKKNFPQAKIRISSNNLTAHREMVLQGLGVSILPEFLVNEDLKIGKLVDLYPHEIFKFEMKFIKRRTGVLSRNAREWVKLCLAEA